MTKSNKRKKITFKEGLKIVEKIQAKTKSNLEEGRKNLDHILEMLDSGVYSQKQAKKYIKAIISSIDQERTNIGNFSKEDIARITALSSIDQMKAHEHRIIEAEREQLAEKIEEMRKDKDKRHICYLNDGKQNCECYLKGYNQAFDDIKKLI